MTKLKLRNEPYLLPAGRRQVTSSFPVRFLPRNLVLIPLVLDRVRRAIQQCHVLAARDRDFGRIFDGFLGSRVLRRLDGALLVGNCVYNFCAQVRSWAYHPELESYGTIERAPYPKLIRLANIQIRLATLRHSILLACFALSLSRFQLEMRRAKQHPS
jgi:hypothetical protein